MKRVVDKNNNTICKAGRSIKVSDLGGKPIHTGDMVSLSVGNSVIGTFVVVEYSPGSFGLFGSKYTFPLQENIKVLVYKSYCQRHHLNGLTDGLFLSN